MRVLGGDIQKRIPMHGCYQILSFPPSHDVDGNLTHGPGPRMRDALHLGGLGSIRFAGFPKIPTKKMEKLFHVKCWAISMRFPPSLGLCSGRLTWEGILSEQNNLSHVILQPDEEGLP